MPIASTLRLKRLPAAADLERGIGSASSGPPSAPATEPTEVAPLRGSPLEGATHALDAHAAAIEVRAWAGEVTESPAAFPSLPP